MAVLSPTPLIAPGSMAGATSPGLDKVLVSDVTGDNPRATGVTVDSTKSDKLGYIASFGAFVTAADGATVTFDFNAGDTQQVTLGGNRTLAFSNFTIGQTVVLLLKQDGTGSRTVTWPSGSTVIGWHNGIPPVLDPTATDGWDLIVLKCVATVSGTTYWRELSRTTGVDTNEIYEAADGSTVTINYAFRRTQKVTLGGNRTVSITGITKTGQVVSVKLIQDGTGSRTVTWSNTISSTPPQPYSSAGTGTWYTFISTSTDGSTLDLVGCTAPDATVTLLGNTTTGTGGTLVLSETPSINFGNTGLNVYDTDASHKLGIVPGSNLTANRSLTLTTGDASRTLTISGDATVNQDYSTSGTPRFAALGIGVAGSTMTPLKVTNSFTDPSATRYSVFVDSSSNTITANNSNLISGLAFDVRMDQNGFNHTATAGCRGIFGQAYASGSSGTVTGCAASVYTGGNIGAGTLDDWDGALVTAALNNAGGTLNRINGVRVVNQTAGTNAYAFRSQIATGSGRWGFYGEGTAPSYFNSQILIGTTTTGNPFNIALGGGSTSPTLNGATADTVSIAAVDNGSGNRELQVQPEAGAVFAFGNSVRRVVVSGSADYAERFATASTTDATQTTVDTIPIASGSTYLIESRIAARRTGGSGGTAEDLGAYVRRAAYKTVTGTVTIVGGVAVIPMASDVESQVGWDATFTISGTNVLVRVTGAVNNNIDWFSVTTVQRIA